MIDIRAAAAKYYDSSQDPFCGKDIQFYIDRLPSPQLKVLEIGCGTGRVLLPLSRHCLDIVGLDVSPSMIEECRRKMELDGTNYPRVRTYVIDVTDFRSSDKYDLVIAPFRVFQNIEEEASIDGFFETIRFHLSDTGRCILNVFKPFASDESEVRKKWADMKVNRKYCEFPVEGRKLVCYDRVSRIHPTKLICYPTLTYELFESDTLVDRTELNIAMRCYLPDDFIRTIENRGFTIISKWGGYSGEVYGMGPELVVEFRKE